MRLIDADTVKADIEQFNRPLCDDYHMKDYVLNQIITDIENQPTVDAIPIEYIVEHMKGFYDHGYTEFGSALEALIMDWREDND